MINLKKKRFDQLKKEEELLIIKQKEIEESKLILNEMEYLNKISNLTDEKKSFEKKVIKLNNYIKKNIEMNEEIVLNEIISIVKKIAEEDNIDIVFSENQYFLASDNVDISSKIFNILNDLNIRLQLSEYE